MKYDIPPFRRMQQIPNWQNLHYHPPPNGQVVKVTHPQLNGGKEFTAIQTHDRKWWSCRPDGSHFESIITPQMWLNGFVVA